MEEYIKLIEKSNGMFDENMLLCGRELSEGCYRGHRGYPFSIDSLRRSKKNINDTFLKYNMSDEIFWKKLRSFNEKQLDLFFTALYEYCRYMGID